MEYICNTIEAAIKALNDHQPGRGDVFLCSDEVYKWLTIQPEKDLTCKIKMEL